MSKKTFTLKEIAWFVMEDLKTTFPQTTFTHRAKRLSKTGETQLEVKWTMGPGWAEVQRVTEKWRKRANDTLMVFDIIFCSRLDELGREIE